MRDFIKLVNETIVLFDGGMGTQLQAVGLELGQAPERWNLDKPDLVEKVHQDYINTGAQVVTTNSFGASQLKLATIGLDNQTLQINQAAAAIARRAVGDDHFVAGSIGPTGALLMMGDVDVKELEQGFITQARGLLLGGVDLFIIETMSDLEEALLALRAVKSISDKPVIVSMTFEPGQHGYRTMMGIDIPTAVKELEEKGADVIGTNCGIGMDKAIEIVKEINELTTLPILAEPNAGLPRLEQDRTVYDELPAEMAQKLPELINSGARIVGGCCGTTPEHTRHFRAILKSRNL
jgi:5-methyltetrahydrofolate--homocysteine methyltransferase